MINMTSGMDSLIHLHGPFSQSAPIKSIIEIKTVSDPAPRKKTVEKISNRFSFDGVIFAFACHVQLPLLDDEFPEIQYGMPPFFRCAQLRYAQILLMA
jgi:hypothetical protein